LINVVGFAGASTLPWPYSSSFLVADFSHCWTAGRSVPLAATRIYQMSFFTGFGISALLYYLLNVIFPVPGSSKEFEEVDLSAEDTDNGGSYTNGEPVKHLKGDDSHDE